MRPLTIAIAPLLLLLPSICVTSKRPYQCCWCRSRKCTLPLAISQDSGSSMRRRTPDYTLMYCYSWFWVATGMRTLFPSSRQGCQTTLNVTILLFLVRQVYDLLSGDITHKTKWWLLPKSISVENKVVSQDYKSYNTGNSSLLTHKRHQKSR